MDLQALAIRTRLQRELDRWEGTPYRPGHQMCGVGADCRTFMIGLFDGLYKRSTPVQDLPPDAALHQPEVARGFLRNMRAYWGAVKGDEFYSKQPGDVMIFAYPGAGPTHVTVVAPDPHFFYHADMERGVEKVPFDAAGLEYHGYYVMPNKESWLEQH